MEKPKPNKPAVPSPAAKKPTGKAAPAAPAPVKVAPLFRKIDWLVLIVSFAVIWIVYLLTLAPDLTLEDSGELCTASFYAGIPHPPGYPFWSIYSWFWTWILPMGSVTWRVEVGESFAAAMACGLVGLMVSRGSSMLIEGIQELNAISRKSENAVCVVCGITAGLLLGFDDFMWKESVVINRISLFDVPWLMVVAVCLMRWIYAPHQRRYLYAAMFFFGLCFTIHQTMLVAAMGIEVAITMANPRLGRDLMLGNSIIYALVLLMAATGKLAAYTDLDDMFKAIFHVVGITSIAVCFWLGTATKSLGTQWRAVILLGLCWLAGAAFYFYEPISGMTDPPMQWGYPRTVEGFFHAFTRGQYERAHPTDIVHEKTRFIMQLGMQVNSLAGSYSWVFLFVALVPFLFLLKMQRRELNWIIGLSAVYLCVGILLTIVMNTTPDRQSAEENKVFFTASHALVAIMIGYGLALLSAFMATHYASFRPMGLALGTVTIVPALVLLYDSVSTTFYGGADLLDYIRTLVLFVCLAGAFVLAAKSVQSFLKVKTNPMLFNEQFYGKICAAGAALLLAFSAFIAFARHTLADLPDNWQTLSFAGRFAAPFNALVNGIPEVFRNLVGMVQDLHRIFVPHQYSLPVIGALLLVAAVVVFISAVTLYRNRAPIIITLGLFILTPVYSGLSHWANGEQRNHWFGYWFGHDMFTPPFEGPDGKFSYDAKLRGQMMKDPNKGSLVYPEMDRNTILFGGTDPGRFNPTYMIFCESFVPPGCKPMDPAFDRRDVYLITQNALADGTYLDYLRAQYYRSAQQDPPFFSRLFRFTACLIGVGNRDNVDMSVNDPDCGKGNSGNRLVEGIAGLLDTVLDRPFTKLGAKIEARRRAEGVYPPKEIYIPSPDDSARCFEEYTRDVSHRAALGQLQPGEIVSQPDQFGRVQVAGQVSVMMINGLLCKVIFDRNPTNSFYVEESFPLEWMYPYETPFGIIMKINREPLVSLPEDVLNRDHEFWSKYSERFIGNWITYKTTVQEITNFVNKIYLRHDYSDFKGDRKFLRDEDAQKAFSKLRDSQAGMYAWRLHLLLPSPPYPPVEEKYLPYRPKSDAEIQQLYQEADFAFKQSFAFCPYSPETVVRYIQFLYQFNRFDDALMVAQTCHQLDPYNNQITDMIGQIKNIQREIISRGQNLSLPQMEAEAQEHPTNAQNLVLLGSAYFQMGQTDRALEIFNQALTNPSLSYNDATMLAQFYSKMGYADVDKLELALQKAATAAPDQPEGYYNLASLEVVLGKNAEALSNLRTAMELNAKRLKANPHAPDLAATNRADPRFNALRSLPEYQKIVPLQ